jgi:hypothetical protein
MSPLLWVTVALAQDAQHHLDQANLFVRKQWYDDAAAELELAIASPGGETSFEAWWLLAQVRYELLDAEAALDAARTALDVAPTPEQAQVAQQYVDWLGGTFGVVELHGPQPAMESRLQLERTSLLFDPELKRFVDRVALAWTHPQALPLRIALPAGEYLIQGREVLVEAGGETRVDLPLSALGNSGFAALQVTRLELAAGVGKMGSARVPDLRPSLELQVGITQPVRGWLIGAIADWSLRSYTVEGYGAVQNPYSATLGVRVGRELMVAGPLAVRPGLGYRYGTLPGVPLSCTDDGTQLVCAPPDGSVAQVHVVAIGRAHIPFAEVSVDWRRAGRTTASGFGVRLVVEHARGTVPDPGTALLPGQDEPTPTSTEDAAWSATGFRMMASFSHAF